MRGSYDGQTDVDRAETGSAHAQPSTLIPTVRVFIVLVFEVSSD